MSKTLVVLFCGCVHNKNSFDADFKIYLFQMVRSLINLPTIVGHNFEIYWSQMAINHLKLSILVGENFETRKHLTRIIEMMPMYRPEKGLQNGLCS